MTAGAAPFGHGPVQIAYPVADVHAAGLQWANQTGAGPFFVAEHITLAGARVDGLSTMFDHSSAYGQWGALMVELVVEHTPPLVAVGSGIHHLAFMVDDLPAAMDRCIDGGWRERLWARTAGGLEFAFLEPDDLGHLVELYEPTEQLRAFYAMVARAAAGWDGHDPVRRL